MIPETPFFLSMAALSASLAGLAGLVAGLRRGPSLGSLEAFRLRQIVEFSFANILIATSVIPLAQLTAAPNIVAHAFGGLILCYLAVAVLLLFRRGRTSGVALVGAQRRVVGVIVVVTTALSVATAVFGSLALLQLLLVALLVRPMTVFLFVIGAVQGTPEGH